MREQNTRREQIQGENKYKERTNTRIEQIQGENKNGFHSVHTIVHKR